MVLNLKGQQTTFYHRGKLAFGFSAGIAGLPQGELLGPPADGSILSISTTY